MATATGILPTEVKISGNCRDFADQNWREMNAKRERASTVTARRDGHLQHLPGNRRNSVAQLVDAPKREPGLSPGNLHDGFGCSRVLKADIPGSTPGGVV